MGIVTLISVVAGLADLVGGWFTIAFALSQDRINQLMALGVGFFLGSALLTMLPAAIAASANGAKYVTLGYLGLYVARQLFQGSQCMHSRVESLKAAVMGLLLHSFFDGAALGAAVRVGGRFGMAAMLAIVLHKLPEGFGIAALALSATHSRRLALLTAAAVGCATVAGAWAALLWATATSASQEVLLGLAAGGFLFVGATDMVPALHQEGGDSWLLVLGVVLAYLLTAFHLH